MGELLKGATLIDLGEPTLAREDLRIEGGRIAARGEGLEPEPGDRVTDLTGRYLTGGFVAAHTHLYATLLRGLPLPSPAPKSLAELLERVIWKLDRALDLETVALSAQAGAAEALRCGVTTLIDHHSSPSCVAGSLSALRQGVDQVGLRAVLSYEVSDRGGPELRAAALRETEAFLARAGAGRVRGMVGAHAASTLEDETLEALSGLARAHGVGVHLHAAESPDDERETRKRFEQGVVQRLAGAGLLGPTSILGHCNHLSWEELSEAQQRGTWLVHCARADMARSTGYAPAGKFGARKALGTDGQGGDILAEGHAAWLRGTEAGFPIDLARWHSGGQNLAGELFGTPIGPLRPGAAADLVVLDYPAPTPVTAETLAGHLAQGLSSAHVDAVMVDGAWRLWARELLSFDAEQARARTEQAARRLWGRMREL